MEQEIERFVLLVDHANIFHNIQQRAVRINYNQLAELIVPWGRGILIAKIIYMGVYRNVLPKRQKFINYLKSEGWVVVQLPILITPKGKRQQKRIDLRMFRHGVGFIQENMCDTVILVSGDGDLAELVISIKELGRKVEVWSFRKSIAHSLIEEAGEENVFYMDDILDQIIKTNENDSKAKDKKPKKRNRNIING